MALPKGYKHFEETKRKIKETNILHAYPRSGSDNPFWGRKHSKKTRQRISDAQAGLHDGDKNQFYGKKHSLETRIKLSATWKVAKQNGTRCGRKGIDSNWWEGGITILNKQIRTCTKYREWRGFVFKRDNWTCQMCPQYGGFLHADHIFAFSKILRKNKIKTLEQALACHELWDTNNGRTLCVGCHKKTETYARNLC